MLDMSALLNVDETNERRKQHQMYFIGEVSLSRKHYLVKQVRRSRTWACEIYGHFFQFFHRYEGRVFSKGQANRPSKRRAKSKGKPREI